MATSVFEFCSVGRIIFGRGEFARIGEPAAQMGAEAMVVSNAGERGDGGPVDRLGELLAAAGVRHEFYRQRGEPRVVDVEQALRIAREAGADLVIGLGGGSAIDAAKAVAGLLTNGGGPLDYMEVIGNGRKITRRAAPWIAVPTTAGTGAEVTRNAVIASPENHFKASIRGAELLASVVIVDPQLGAGVRAEITARAGADALCQLIESYTSNRAQPITDALGARGMALGARSLLKAYRDGSDLDAREDMALAALLGGIALSNAGLGAVHGFAAPLGANFPVPHGTVCGTLLPHVMRANIAALRRESPEHAALARYAAVGRALTGRRGLGDAGAIDAGLTFVEELIGNLELPPLGEFGLAHDRVGEMVELAARSSSIRYNPVKLSDEILAEVLTAAMRGGLVAGSP